uniref:Uncharacterized protein n=1 Tax=Solanum lycopersicum TaxID=4081 RepID=A0A3Q7EDE8_SOLLC
MDWSTSEDQAGAISHIFSAPCQDLRPISGLTISVADIGYLCMSSFISVSVHELGHVLAAARCISHAALINETSGARKSEAHSGKWKLKGQESDPGSPATYFWCLADFVFLLRILSSRALTSVSEWQRVLWTNVGAGGKRGLWISISG